MLTALLAVEPDECVARGAGVLPVPFAVRPDEALAPRLQGVPGSGPVAGALAGGCPVAGALADGGPVERVPAGRGGGRRGLTGRGEGRGARHCGGRGAA
ncbi:hypothetical protein DC008_26020 [Streptomyces nigra]|nr:hypothetical protein DC008_26020 [Streptomyces nigra]